MKLSEHDKLTVATRMRLLIAFLGIANIPKDKYTKIAIGILYNLVDRTDEELKQDILLDRVEEIFNQELELVLINMEEKI